MPFTLDDAKAALQAKLDQLFIYRNTLEGDSDVTIHARTVASGRIIQIEQDIETLNKITF